MAAAMGEMAVRRNTRVELLAARLGPNDHPLHLFVSREDANDLHIADDTTCVIAALSVRHQLKNEVSGLNLSMSSGLESPSPSVSGEVKLPPYSDNVCYRFSSEILTYVWVHDPLLLDLSTPLLADTADDEEELNHEKRPRLLCSDDFLDHYKLSLSDVVYFRQVHLFPLRKVVIAVSDKEAYTWLRNNKFSNGIITEIIQHEVVAKKDQDFLAPYPPLFLEDNTFQCTWFSTMKVVECTPLHQGIVTVNTEIVLFFDEFTNQTIVDRRKRLSTATIEHLISKPDNLYVSDFCRSISTVSNQTDRSRHTSGSASSLESSSVLITFNSFVVEQDRQWRKILGKDLERTSDPHNFIGIPKKLMLQHGLFEGSILKVSLSDSVNCESEDPMSLVGSYGRHGNDPVTSPVLESRKLPKQKAVTVKCLARHLSGSEKVFISALLWFNLHSAPPLTEDPVLVCEKLSDDSIESDVDEGSHSLSSSLDTSLPVASEIHISIINSPNYSPRMNYTEALKKYFQVARIASHGDVFAIKSADDPQFWQTSSLDTGMRFPVMFFKVTRVEPCRPDLVACMVDSFNTRLLQVGSVHSYVPQIAYQYFAESDPSYWQQLTCPGLNSYITKLESILLPHLSKRFDNTRLKELPPSVLLSGPSACGKTTVVCTVAKRLCLHVNQVNCHHLSGDAAGATESRIKNAFLAAAVYAPCILLLKNVHVVGKERDGASEDPRVISSFHNSILEMTEQAQEFPLIVIATTHNAQQLSQDMQEAFLHDIKIETPNELERREIVHGLMESEVRSADISLPRIAQRTAGFVLGDLVALAGHAKRQAYVKALKLCAARSTGVTLEMEEDLVSAGVVIEQADVDTALDKLQAAHSDTIGAPKIPNVTWKDVGGLADVKSDILDTVQLPLQHPELLAAGLKRSGVLLYGPPGTGKTLLAKAVATECSLNFLSVKGPELINMYVGQSEENIREVFKRARSATPCVIFFDELDSLAPNRGRSGDSGGVMDRVVSQLLAELDGLHKSCDVFVIGATNRPDLLDPALLRPGRFDKLLYLGVADTRDAQLKVLASLTRKFHLDPDLSLKSVVEKCPWNMTGADFYALSSDAMLFAIKRKIIMLEAGEEVDQSVIEVCEIDFLEALKQLTPSVSEMELARYKYIRDSFDGK
ncbi:peroxisomal ATPase PEX6-like [Haliotis cracherodii]|uniref:peroxisomal ATPase PEX6-like n=1 Tax=Haliotis cracherodii TaxID=6455 RepID=UPI0039EB3D35